MQWVEKKSSNKVHFIRIDISDPHAREIMTRYKIPLNSANLIFDAKGKEVWRSYMIPMNGPGALRALNRLTDG